MNCPRNIDFSSAFIKRGIDGVKFLAVKMLLRDAESIGKTIRVKHYYVN